METTVQESSKETVISAFNSTESAEGRAVPEHGGFLGEAIMTVATPAGTPATCCPVLGRMTPQPGHRGGLPRAGHCAALASRPVLGASP